MKRISQLLTVCALPLLFACETGEIEPDNNGETHSVSITGIKDAFSYSFTPANGRVASAPDEVYMLTIKLINENNHVVYEQWYHDWSDTENHIPDSIFIPSISAGNYKIYASTADYYYYYDYYYESGNVDLTDAGDSIPDQDLPMQEFVIDNWIVSENPIYVGNQSFTVADEDVSVELEMTNISAKLTLQVKNFPQEMYAEVMAIGTDALSYSFDNDAFFNQYPDHESYAYLYMYDGRENFNFYFLPRTLDRVRVGVYDYNYNYFVEQEYSFNEDIEMGVGDALTVTVDMESILDGGGSGTLSWQSIEWNNLGEVVIE